jgi:hypothetical protein
MLTDEQEKITESKSDFPCQCKNEKALFLLFCLENLDHIESDSDKDVVISKSMKEGQYTPSSISDSAVALFAATDKGIHILSSV